MDGIIILNTYMKYVAGPGISAPVIVMALITLLCIGGFIACWKADDASAGGFLVAALLFGCFCWLLYGIGDPEYSGYEVQQVMIDKSVSLVEFEQKYEILSHDGLIYTIRERDN